MTVASPKYVRFFEEFGIDDVPLVGGKNASLGEMYRKLSGRASASPTASPSPPQAYRYMLDEANAWDPLHAALDGSTPTTSTPWRAGQARPRDRLRRRAADDLAAEILDAYRASAGVRRGHEPGRSQLGHRRGPAHGELRRPAGYLSQRARRAELCSTPAGAVSPASSPTAPSTTGSTRASTTSRSPCRSAS